MNDDELVPAENPPSGAPLDMLLHQQYTDDIAEMLSLTPDPWAYWDDIDLDRAVDDLTPLIRVLIRTGYRRGTADPYALGRAGCATVNVEPIEITPEEAETIAKPSCYATVPDPADSNCQNCRLLLPCLSAKLWRWRNDK